MPSIETICTKGRYVGNSYECDAIRQCGRDWNWDDIDGTIEDPESTARDLVSILEREAIDPETGATGSVVFDDDARNRLVAALWQSAERHNRDVAAEVSS